MYPNMRAGFMLIVVIGSLTLLLTAPATALETGGLGGEITVGAIYFSGRPSQLVVGDDNATVTRLASQADRETMTDADLSGKLHYRLPELGTTLYVSAANGSADLDCGVRQSMGPAGVIDLALQYGIDEVWRDPYVTNVKRRTTEVETVGLRLRYEEIYGTGAFLSATASGVDVAQDLSGDRRQQLRRDGELYAFHFGYRLALGDHAELTTSLGVDSQDLQGAANASDGVGAEVTYGWQRGPWLFETAVGVHYSEYRAEHPSFGKTRKATGYEGSAMMGYIAPFGWTPLTLYGLVGYARSDENIAFFDAEGWMTGVGVGLSF
ncbi:MAG: DUF2860 family protein [Desulfosarcinaceae bacterium]|nr:DUF2860 family protein [Desulfosarcinaceae bacterium]